VKSIKISDYNFDYDAYEVLCDQQPLNCLKAAFKVQEVCQTVFSFLDWIYYFCLDVLAYFLRSFKERQFFELSPMVEKIQDAQEKILVQYQKVESFVKNKFKVLAKNVEYLVQAEVICLGESHGNQEHMQNNALLIDVLSEKDTDLILVEHDEEGAFRSDQAKYVRSPVPVQGWDKIDQTTLQKMISILKLPKSSPQREKKLSWVTQKILDDLPGRNRYMTQTIESYLSENKRIYVIAGRGHFSLLKGERIAGYNYQPLEICVQETLDYLKTKKFAILVPNQ
jgi:hypothetical protein